MFTNQVTLYCQVSKKDKMWSSNCGTLKERYAANEIN
jgi:hypothetical protein